MPTIPQSEKGEKGFRWVTFRCHPELWKKMRLDSAEREVSIQSICNEALARYYGMVPTESAS